MIPGRPEIGLHPTSQILWLLAITVGAPYFLLSATAPLLLFFTARPEFRAPWPMRAHHAQITLNRLSERHTREMIAGVAATGALAKDVIDAVVKRHGVDAFVALTSQPAWIVDPVNGDVTRGGCTSLPAVAGYPHLTVPAGFAGRLPVGISFFGAAFTEPRLLGIGHAYEQAAPHRRPPEFHATA